MIAQKGHIFAGYMPITPPIHWHLKVVLAPSVVIPASAYFAGLTSGAPASQVTRWLNSFAGINSPSFTRKVPASIARSVCWVPRCRRKFGHQLFERIVLRRSDGQSPRRCCGCGITIFPSCNRVRMVFNCTQVRADSAASDQSYDGYDP